MIEYRQGEFPKTENSLWNDLLWSDQKVYLNFGKPEDELTLISGQRIAPEDKALGVQYEVYDSKGFKIAAFKTFDELNYYLNGTGELSTFKDR